MALISVGQRQPPAPRRKIGTQCKGVSALVVRMVLMLPIAATVHAVTVDNTMTELQMQHAARMASVPIAQGGSDDIGIGSNVMALHRNGQMWPGSISRLEEFTDGTVIYTVAFLDRTASCVGLQNIHHRDNTVSYDNFGSTALCNVNVNSTNMPGPMASSNGGSAAAGGSAPPGPFRAPPPQGGPGGGAGSSSPASVHAGPFRGTRSRSGGSGAAGGTPTVLCNAGGPAVVFRNAGSRLPGASPTRARPVDWEQQAREFQRQRNESRLACSVAISERDQHRDAHEITVNTLMRRTAECNTMHRERDAALDAVDARDTAMQEFQAALPCGGGILKGPARKGPPCGGGALKGPGGALKGPGGAEGKKRKVDNSAGSVDIEQRARTFENERDMAFETRDAAIAARVAAEQAATFATQRAEASDLRATAAEHRVAVMQQELQAAQAELAALRRAGASGEAAYCDVKDKGSRN